MIPQLAEKLALLSETQQQKVLNFINQIVDEEGVVPKRYYEPDKLDYTEEDIKGIIAQFPKKHKWTWNDLQNPLIFPELVKFKVELLHHKIYIMKPKPIHQEILTNLTVYMGMYVLPHGLGKLYVAPVGVHIDEGTVLEPDVMFISVARQHIMTEKGVVEAPDLVVEVISRANYKKLREKKKEQYALFGVQEYWEIHPKKKKVIIETLQVEADGTPRFEVYAEATKTGSVQSNVLAGFVLDIEKIFPAEVR